MNPDEKRERLNLMAQGWSQCQGCMLCQTRQNVVFGSGSSSADLVIVGEAPGSNENATGYPFVGVAGKLLEYYLAWTSADLEQFNLIGPNGEFDDTAFTESRNKSLDRVFFTNIVCCQPPENRNPTPKEIAACRPRLLETIYTIDPVLIIAVGGLAAEALTGKKVSITALRGQVIDCELPGRLGPVKYPTLLTLHTSYILRQSDFNQDDGVFEKTYADYVLAGHILDEFNFHHKNQPRPSTRPALPEPDKK